MDIDLPIPDFPKYEKHLPIYNDILSYNKSKNASLFLSLYNLKGLFLYIS